MPFYRTANYQAKDSIGYLLNVARTGLAEHIESAMEELGLNHTQWVVLLWIKQGVVRSSAEVCRQMRYDTGSMTRLLDQLENKGLITRSRSLEDRRVVQLSLTAAGEDAYEALLPRVLAQLNAALEGFSRDEVTELKRLLRKMMENLA